MERIQLSFEMLFILHIVVLICYSADGFPDLRLPYVCELKPSGRFPEESDSSPYRHAPAHRAASLRRRAETEHRHPRTYKHTHISKLDGGALRGRGVSFTLICHV